MSSQRGTVQQLSRWRQAATLLDTAEAFASCAGAVCQTGEASTRPCSSAALHQGLGFLPDSLASHMLIVYLVLTIATADVLGT